MDGDRVRRPRHDRRVARRLNLARWPPRSSAEIREAFLSFFEERDHRACPPASLVPSSYDPSVLLTTAGMQPFKPYFLGQEQPPHPRLTSCQKCFRTTDIDEVGNTARHLTFFEMLGNFSFGDYFKEGAVGYAWELSTQGFGLDPERIWITVFEGDAELGLGPDEEAIECWRAVGVPPERIVRLPRSDNFWQAGPTGPCGPCSELYYRPRSRLRRPRTAPATTPSASSSSGTSSSCSTRCARTARSSPCRSGTSTPAWASSAWPRSSRTCPRSTRPTSSGRWSSWASELSGRRYGADPVATRALRVLADHSRAMTFLIADGVVPSNEDRGYILRRIMRRAIQQGRAIGLEPPFLGRFADVVIEIMGDVYPELRGRARRDPPVARVRGGELRPHARAGHAAARASWSSGAKQQGTSWIDAEDAFRLHDTYGFPYDLTRELLAERGAVGRRRRLRRADGGAARARAHGRGDARTAPRASTSRCARSCAARASRRGSSATRRPRSRRSVGALAARQRLAVDEVPGEPLLRRGRRPGGRLRRRRERSGAAGSRTSSASATTRRSRSQVERGRAARGRARAARRSTARRATRPSATTPPPTCCTRPCASGSARTCARPARPCGRTSCASTSRTASRSRAEELRAIEDRVNDWILESHPVRAIHTTRTRAEELGAMALFGEKYGDEVRVVEVEDVSRELCGGTHVRPTSEIGVFKILREGSSAANVRRIEAVTGPEAVRLLREHDDALGEIAELLRTRPEDARARVESQLERAARARARAQDGRRRPRAGAGDELGRGGRRDRRRAGGDGRMRRARHRRAAASWPTG